MKPCHWVGLVVLGVVQNHLSAIDLDAITVTGTGTAQRLSDSPVVTEIITAQEITDSGASDLAGILQKYGVVLDQGSSHGTQATLEGLGDGRVLILIDGRRVAGRVAQNVEGQSLSLVNVDRIEIVRGPQSALYGSDAMGGVINIITKPAAPKPSGRLEFENTSLPAYNDPSTPRGPANGPAWAQTQHLDGVWNQPLGPWSTVVTLDGLRSSYYYNEAGEVSLLPRSLKGTLGLEGTYDGGAGNQFTAGISGTGWQEDDQTDFTGSYDRENLARIQGHGGWKTTLADGSSLETTLSDQWYRRATSTYTAGTSSWANTEPDQESLTSGQVRYSRDLSSENTLTLGAESSFDAVHSADLDSSGFWLPSDTEALVAQDEQFSENQYSVVTGLRVERSSRFGFFGAPKVSAMVMPWPGVRLLGGAGLGYRAPSTEDLYYDINWSWHPIVLGNRNLTPEYSVAGNLGIEVTPRKELSFRINGYHQELFNEIAYVQTGTASDGRAIYQNQNKTRTTRSGFDTEVTWKATEFASLDAAYGYVFAWDRTAQQLITTVAAHQIRSGVTLGWAPWGLSVHSSAQWDSLKNLVVLDLGVTEAWNPSFETYVRADNLTNAIDAARGPFTPVSVTLGARIKA